MKSLIKIASTAVVMSAASACAMGSGDSKTKSPMDSIRQTYVFESDANGFNTKTVFYDNGSEVVAFDAQFTSTLAQESIKFLRSKTSSPLTYLVVTHPNPDKFNGIDVFRESGAKVIASKATALAMPGVHAYKKYFFVNIAKMFSEETYPALGTIDLTFDDKLDLELDNGERIHLSELAGPGVSSTQTVAHIPAVNALIVGDLIHHNAHAWLEGGIVDGKPTPTVGSWVQDIEELLVRFGRKDPIVYGGRGEAGLLSVVAPAQIAYLKKADHIVSDYVASLGERRSELSTASAQEHFGNIQKIFEKEFPNFTLPYMIQYGVYGLALSN